MVDGFGWTNGVSLLLLERYGWPAAVFDADAAEEVPGVVVSIHAELLEEALASLDEVEGVDGGLFQRVVIDVGGLSCWAYHWPESTEAFHRIQRR